MGIEDTVGAYYLFLGLEKGKKQEQINLIISDLEKKSSQKVDLHKIYPFDEELSFVLDIARNGSLFSSDVVIIVNQIDQFKAKDITLFSSFMKEGSSTATLIFLSDENSSSKISQSIVKQIPKENIQIFWEMFESNKKGWLKDFFSKENIVITPQAIDYILEMLENNTADFRVACEQIVLAHPKNQPLTLDAVEEYLFHSKEENVFSLFEKVVEQDFQSAVDILHKITFSDSAAYPQLLGGMLWQLKNLLSWAHLYQQNYSFEDIANRLNVKAKRVKSQMQLGCSNYSVNQLNDMIILTTRIDSLIRESKADVQQLLMDLYLYYLVVRKGECEGFQSALSFLE